MELFLDQEIESKIKSIRRERAIQMAMSTVKIVADFVPVIRRKGRGNRPELVGRGFKLFYVFLHVGRRRLTIDVAGFTTFPLVVFTSLQVGFLVF